ncbi:MAG: SUF system NifU family Fe-S cluster assembly protein [Elusimicrobia bacterium]|nr:SUF system NifU family Fe-S cluster assembly protein [Elusimicrobiota bacterium]
MAEGDAELTELYRDVLLDYYRSGSHKGRLPDPDIHSHGVNPICGDEVELTVSRRGEHIGQIRYMGHGCVISQASVAMMAEALEGRDIRETQNLVEAFRGMLLRRLPAESLPEALEDAKAMAGVQKFPVRIKCALLAWNTMKLGLESKGSGRETVEYQETER